MGLHVREFDTGATRDDEGDKLDYEGFLSPNVLVRFAEYMNEHRKQSDGVLRDSDNWQKGIPVEAYMKSMWRHFMDVWLNYRNVELHDPVELDEALCALLFNVQGMLHEYLTGKFIPMSELTDITNLREVVAYISDDVEGGYHFHPTGVKPPQGWASAHTTELVEHNQFRQHFHGAGAGPVTYYLAEGETPVKDGADAYGLIRLDAPGNPEGVGRYPSPVQYDF